MTKNRARASFSDKPLIWLPDGCNLGTALRILLTVNVSTAALLLFQTNDWRVLLDKTFLIAQWLEPTLILTLLGYCFAHKLMARFQQTQRLLRSVSFVNFLQYTLSMAVTMLAYSAVCWVLQIVFKHDANVRDWLLGSVLAGLCGYVCGHYFKLRSLRHSPVLIQARLQALQARMHPHFFFNSINTVLSLIRSNPRQAERTLEDLAELFRALMRDNRMECSLSEEIKLCQQYLNIEAIRLGDRLKLDWRIPHRLENARVPVLILQPLVENAVLHGIEPASRGGTLTIGANVESGKLILKVRNTIAYSSMQASEQMTDTLFGKWITLIRNTIPLAPSTLPKIEKNNSRPVRKGNNMALDNIRQRLALLYDLEAELMAGQDNEFYSVTIRLPFVSTPNFDQNESEHF